MNLTTTDLDEVLTDDRHAAGWGWDQRRYLSKYTRDNASAVVIAVANERGWSKEDLFTWADSKYGRWLSDTLNGLRLSQRQIREDERAMGLITLKGLDR